MGEADRDDLKIKLDDFSRRLDKRRREFASRGELTDSQQSLMNEIQRHQDRIQTKLDGVEASGTAWAVIKAEIEGEFHSLADKLALLDEKLDADEMRQHEK
jgi:hypothetical protein